MRYKSFVVHGLLGLLLVHTASCELQAPPTTTNNNNVNSVNKNRDTSGSHETTKNSNENRDRTDEAKEFTSSVPDTQGDGSDALKVVQAPDLTKEKDNSKTPPLESWVEKLVNQKLFYKVIEDAEGNMRYVILQGDSSLGVDLQEEDDELPPLPEKLLEHVELSPTEKEAKELYEAALQVLNKTRPNRAEAFKLLLQAVEKGNSDAKALVAWANLFGNPLPQDLADAKEMFEELANRGHPEGHMGLGFLYATGLSVNASQARALVHYTFAAVGGNTWAQMVMAYRYWGAVTVPSVCERALDYYRLVAEKVSQGVSFGGGAAIQRIRLLDEHENGYTSGILDNDLIEYYELLAEKGDVQAQVGLGQLHYQGGRGVDLDYQKAMHYFTQAANAGNAIAMAYLGKIYLDGSDEVKQDNDTAFKYFKKASELNNPVGLSGLGLMYLYGRGVDKDYTKAQKYFLAAAEQGWVDGQLQLGNMYLNGIGVIQDYKMANKYFTMASHSGHVLAYYNLGQMHAQGTGTMRSCPTAVEFFKNVAERGRWGELLMQAHGDYRNKKFNEAFTQYALLAELGYEVAQSNSAFMLERNEVPIIRQSEGLVRALLYWGRAASQGYSAAQVKVGDYHYYGHGTSVDYEVAASHYRLASEQQHNAQAMFNLGYMHEQGLGMQQDIHLAKRCYDLAAESSPDAKVPVALALFKLNFMFNIQNIQESPFAALYDVSELVGNNWDLYLIMTLSGFLAGIVYFRRPQQQPAQG